MKIIFNPYGVVFLFSIGSINMGLLRMQTNDWPKQTKPN